MKPNRVRVQLQDGCPLAIVGHMKNNCAIGKSIEAQRINFVVDKIRVEGNPRPN